MNRVLAVLAFAVASFTGATAFAQADPPGRVGRISLLQGEVMFRNTASGESEPAVLNWPITDQAALATAARGRAEVRIGSTTVRIDGDSEVEFAAVDDERIHVRLIQGSTNIRVKNREQLAGLEILTPQGRITALDVGRYRIDSGRAPETTAVTVQQGAARFENADGAFTIQAGKRAEAQGRNTVQFRVSEALRDDFDDWVQARDRRDDAARSARYVSPEMTGYEDLDEYGAWRDMPEYGPVWVPNTVAADWAPYRTGRWAWVEPWGWTWVDAAPWGFAPFHYGRWVLVGGVWGWVPGRVVARPVYAPALVAWVGRPGWNVSASFGSVAAVGWFPLGPREVYYPGYRCSTHYVRNVNVTHVTNVTNINVTNVDARNQNYMHRTVTRAVTVAPQNVVASGRPVAPAAIPIRDRRELAAVPVSNAVPDPAITPRRQQAEPRPDERGAPQGRQRGAQRAVEAERRQSAVQPDRRDDKDARGAVRRDREAQSAERSASSSPPRVEPRRDAERNIAPQSDDRSRVPLANSQDPAKAMGQRPDDRPRVVTPQQANRDEGPARAEDRSRALSPRAVNPSPPAVNPNERAARVEDRPRVVAPRPVNPNEGSARPDGDRVRVPTPQPMKPLPQRPEFDRDRPEPPRIVAPQAPERVAPRAEQAARPNPSQVEDRARHRAPSPPQHQSRPAMPQQAAPQLPQRQAVPPPQPAPAQQQAQPNHPARHAREAGARAEARERGAPQPR